MKNIIAIVCFLLMTQVFAAPITLVYKAKGGKHVDFLQTYRIETLPEGRKVVLVFTEKGELDRRHEVIIDNSGATQKWDFFSPKTGLKITSYRKNGEVILVGEKKGKKTEKKFKVGNQIWMQIFPTGLESFALSNEGKKEFFSIGIEGLAEMELGGFVAKDRKTETFKDDYITAESVALTLTFDDWKSKFWTGKSWHRKTDGRILGIHVGRDIGTWELISEK